MIRILYSLVLVVISVNTIWAQKYNMDMEFEERHAMIEMEDHTIDLTYKTHQKPIKVNNDLWYTWYKSNMIMTTRGGYDGKLLHGSYTEHFNDLNLKVSGSYNYGLKDRKWRYWLPSGELEKLETWSKGFLHGEFAIYDDNGTIVEQGRYKNGVLHGWYYTYTNGKQEKVRYKNGKEIPPKTKRTVKEKKTKEEQPKDRNKKKDPKKKKEKGS